MPFYEYRCDECGAHHEALQKVSDDPLTECPACGAHALSRLISAPAFRLKGSGWYETDFKSGNKRNLVESGDTKPGDNPKMSDSGGAKPAAPRTESKPAPKAEPKGGAAD